MNLYFNRKVSLNLLEDDEQAEESIVCEDGDSFVCLESLNLSLNDLSAVPGAALTPLHHVLRVNLAGTRLQHAQLHSLLQAMTGAGETRLRHLILCDVDLSAVNQELLASGCRRLSTLNLKVSQVKSRSIASLLNSEH